MSLAALTVLDTAGYLLLGADGGVLCFGGIEFHGSLRDRSPESGAVAIDGTSAGYLIVTANGEVAAFGNVDSHGGLPGGSAAPVAIAITAGGAGYWILDAAGGVFSFGAAEFHGSLPGLGGVLHDRPVGLEPTPSGRGYWIVDASGGVFAFGDARYFGSIPERGATLRGAAASVAGDGRGGYVILDEGGRLHRFANGDTLDREIDVDGVSARAVAVSRMDDGWLVVDSRGACYPVGRAAFRGSAAGLELASEIVDAVALRA